MAGQFPPFGQYPPYGPWPAYGPYPPFAPYPFLNPYAPAGYPAGVQGQHPALPAPFQGSPPAAPLDPGRQQGMYGIPHGQHQTGHAEVAADRGRTPQLSGGAELHASAQMAAPTTQPVRSEPVVQRQEESVKQWTESMTTTVERHDDTARLEGSPQGDVEMMASQAETDVSERVANRAATLGAPTPHQPTEADAPKRPDASQGTAEKSSNPFVTPSAGGSEVRDTSDMSVVEDLASYKAPMAYPSGPTGTMWRDAGALARQRANAESACLPPSRTDLESSDSYLTTIPTDSPEERVSTTRRINLRLGGQQADEIEGCSGGGSGTASQSGGVAKALPHSYRHDEPPPGVKTTKRRNFKSKSVVSSDEEEDREPPPPKRAKASREAERLPEPENASTFKKPRDPMRGWGTQGVIVNPQTKKIEKILDQSGNVIKVVNEEGRIATPPPEVGAGSTRNRWSSRRPEFHYDDEPDEDEDDEYYESERPIEKRRSRPKKGGRNKK